MNDKCTLIVIDVQNDFCKGGSLVVPCGDNIVPLINELQKKFGTVVYTRDNHPSDHISFVSNHDGLDVFTECTIKLPNGAESLQMM